MSGATPFDPWQRAFVEITCNDAAAAAEDGNEDAILLDEEMRAKNRGSCYVLARPGDNIWKLGYEALQVTPDMAVIPRPFMHEPGHA